MLFLLVAAAASATAQESTDASERDPSQAARFRLGPLRFTPSISLTNLGIDNNVFNDPLNPKQDTVGAAGPAVDLWMHAGRSLFSGKASVEYLYFDTYENERAWNSSHRARWEVPLSRFIPFIEGSYANTKNRSGYEIDARLRQTDQNVRLGTELALSSQMRLVLSGARSRLAYDEQESVLASAAAAALNRWSNTETMQLRYKLTTLTTFVVNAQAVQDRFEGEALRNANSIAVMPGFEMKPSALVSGRVLVGMRDFAPLQTIVPPYRGPVASVDATYIVRATRLAMKVSRDVNYSYQAVQPYYALTDVGLAVTQRLTYTWDVVLSAARQTLDYTAIRTAGQASTDPQIDTVHQFSAGFGYRIGHTLRLGVDGIYFHRRSSNVALRDFEGFRAGASVTYGLPQ
jgi:hypothetical protein